MLLTKDPAKRISFQRKSDHGNVSAAVRAVHHTHTLSHTHADSVVQHLKPSLVINRHC